MRLGLRPRTWAKITIGVLVIGGTFAVLWAIFRPTVDAVVPVKPPPRPPLLHHSRALVVYFAPGSQAGRRARITCDGRRRTATGFWARTPAEACDALASTRSGLLSGPGCRRMDARRDRLHAIGSFGARRFDHRSQAFGCPDPDAWLKVDALVSGLIPPERKLTGRSPG